MIAQQSEEPAFNRDEVRHVIFTVLKDLDPQGMGLMQVPSIIAELRRRLPAYSTRNQQAALTAFFDLFLEGYLSWGYDFNNFEGGKIHLTENGLKAIGEV